MIDPIAIVSSIYDAFGRGDLAAVLGRVSEDVSWEEWSDRFERDRPRFDTRLRLRRVALRYVRPLVHPDGRAAVDAARQGPELETIEVTVPFELGWQCQHFVPSGEAAGPG